ncbi:unnamed protein product [Notodromas monacha]|uniref:Uncharacterized protein n=1 Tax=Notodromas monacha TaxID=399045 RepID=A0A7R9G9S2_9CRUS|nr:unnamed protein product [Notodromas monacha]CAG0914543.1 unnamed protein product [Notodromas monacha]
MADEPSSAVKGEGPGSTGEDEKLGTEGDEGDPAPQDEEKEKQDLKYPRHVFLILAYDIMSALSGWTLNTVFKTYLVTELKMEPKLTSQLLTVYSFCGIFLALAWGGRTVLAVSAAGRTSNMNAFAGDQFKSPEQDQEKERFFYWMYTIFNLGAFIANVTAPLLRDLPCFGKNDCYPLALGVAAIFGVFGIKNKWTKPAVPEYTHWLHYAQLSGYTYEFTEHTRHFLGTLLLLAPYPVYWSLYDLSSSRLQDLGYVMNGTLPYTDYTLKADQLYFVNPVLIWLLVPICIYFVFPFCHKIGILTTLLQKLVAGFWVMVACLVACVAIVYMVDSSMPPSAGRSDFLVQLVNGLDDPGASATVFLHQSGPGGGPGQMRTIPPGGTGVWNLLEPGKSYSFSSDVAGSQVLGSVPAGEPGLGYTGLVTGSAAAPAIRMFPGPDEFVGRTVTNRPAVRAIVLSPGAGRVLELFPADEGPSAPAQAKIDLPSAAPGPSPYLDKPDVKTYDIKVDGKLTQTTRFASGGVYSIMVSGSAGAPKTSVVVQASPADVHLLWILLIIFLATASEVLASPTSVAFFYSESLDDMKSVAQACYNGSTSLFGPAMVLIQEIDLLMWHEFVVYLVGIVLSTLLMMFIASRYRSREDMEKHLQDEADDKNNKDNMKTRGSSGLSTTPLPTADSDTLDHSTRKSVAAIAGIKQNTSRITPQT